MSPFNENNVTKETAGNMLPIKKITDTQLLKDIALDTKSAIIAIDYTIETLSSVQDLHGKDQARVERLSAHLGVVRKKLALTYRQATIRYNKLTSDTVL